MSLALLPPCSNKYNLFLESINSGRANEVWFHRLTTFVSLELQKKSHPFVILKTRFSLHYDHQKYIISPPRLEEMTSPKLFTLIVLTRSLSGKLYQILTSTPGNDLADNAKKDFAMEDITLLELKSKTTLINDAKCLENLNLKNLKVIELLRQFKRFYKEINLV